MNALRIIKTVAYVHSEQLCIWTDITNINVKFANEVNPINLFKTAADLNTVIADLSNCAC